MQQRDSARAVCPRCFPYLPAASTAPPGALDILPAPGLSAEKANECENKIRPFAPTEEVKQYYTRLEPEHTEQLEKKKAAKNKARTKKQKSKKAKIAMANKHDEW